MSIEKVVQVIALNSQESFDTLNKISSLKAQGITIDSRDELIAIKALYDKLSADDKDIIVEELNELSTLYAQCVASYNEAFITEQECVSKIIGIKHITE